jgi:HD superfamily phosphohydrolase
MVRRTLAVEEGGLEAVESLLISRNMMYQTVYRHHTKRVVESMIEHALDAAYDKGLLPKEKYVKYDDLDVVNILRNCGGYPTAIIRLIERRLLFKPVYHARVSLLERKTVNELKNRSRELENKIAKDYGIEEGFVCVDYPKSSSLSEFKVKVDSESGLKALDKVSSLARSLEKSDKEKLVAYVYADRQQTDKLRQFKADKYIAFK